MSDMQIPVRLTILEGRGPVDISPALAESEWIDKFRALVVAAYCEARKLHDSPPFSESLRVERITWIRTLLRSLYGHLMEAWERRDEAGVLPICDWIPGAIHPNVREAYIEAHDMFRELEKRRELNPAKFTIPLSPLGRINGLLTEVATHPAPSLQPPPTDSGDVFDSNRAIACSQNDAWTFFFPEQKKAPASGMDKLLTDKFIIAWRKEGTTYWVIAKPAQEEQLRDHVKQRAANSGRGKASKSVSKRSRA